MCRDSFSTWEPSASVHSTYRTTFKRFQRAQLHSPCGECATEFCWIAACLRSSAGLKSSRAPLVIETISSRPISGGGGGGGGRSGILYCRKFYVEAEKNVVKFLPAYLLKPGLPVAQVAPTTAVRHVPRQLKGINEFKSILSKTSHKTIQHPASFIQHLQPLPHQKEYWLLAPLGCRRALSRPQVAGAGDQASLMYHHVPWSTCPIQ